MALMQKLNDPLSLSEFIWSFEKLKPRLSLLETEESWEKVLNALEELEKLCQLGACEHTSELISSIRSIHRNITSAMNSERTRLSGAALDTIGKLASRLNADFEPLMSLFLPGLLLLCGRTNKVVAARAKACILTIIDATQLPGVLTQLANFVKDKSPTIRLVVAEGTLSCLKCFNPPDLEKEIFSRSIENIIRSAVRDANADIRRVGKDIFQSYKVLLPHRVESFAAPLTPTIRKHLQLGSGNGAGQAMGAVPQTKSVSKRTGISQSTESGKTTGSSGPIRPTKTCTGTALPRGASIQHAAPLRSIQVPPKRREELAVKAPEHRHLPLTRPFPPTAANIAGPQRVIKPFTPSVGVVHAPTNERHAYVPVGGGGPVRLEKPTHSSIASTGPIPLPPSSRPTHLTRRQLPSKDLKRVTTIDTGRATAKSRDITRPTLSQLARVKPVLARPQKVAQGLNIRQVKSPVDSDSTRADYLPGSSNMQISTKGVRPITPTSIPLPESPEPTPAEDQNLEKQENIFEAESSITNSEAVAASVPDAKTEDTLTSQRVQIEGTETPAAVGDRVANFQLSSKTPISALLFSIQQGFDLTPCSPLSPAQHYAPPELGSPYESTPFQLGVIASSVPRP